MKQKRILSLLVALCMLLGSMVGTSALASTNSTTATTSVVTAETSDTGAAANATATAKPGLGKQILILLAFAAGVGLLAAGYGIVSMRYNAEKVGQMKEESQKLIENIHKDDHRKV